MAHHNNLNSFMNNSKWKKVLDILVEHKEPVKVKLLYHEMDDRENIVVAYNSYGKPFFTSYQKLFNPVGIYYEGSQIGPFKPSKIEWLELSKEFYMKYFDQIKLQIEISSETVKIYGYR